MDDSGTYVLCDFGSATSRFLNPQKQSIKDIEEELQRLGNRHDCDFFLCYLMYYVVFCGNSYG